MSKQDKYLKAPLAILRRGSSASEVLQACIHVGIVNAGIGYRKIRSEQSYLAVLEEARAKAWHERMPFDFEEGIELHRATGEVLPFNEASSLWRDALVGHYLVRAPDGNRADDVQCWLNHGTSGRVFFCIKTGWVWNALRTARREDGEVIHEEFKVITWREFRILAAILSAPVNSWGFCFLGWQSIQARACGFQNKSLFASHRDTLPIHCQPLSRQMIRDATEKLEALGFFGRCRYSTGKRGGYMAYSMRHPTPEALRAAVERWAAATHSLEKKIRAKRAGDQAFFDAVAKMNEKYSGW